MRLISQKECKLDFRNTDIASGFSWQLNFGRSNFNEPIKIKPVAGDPPDSSQVLSNFREVRAVSLKFCTS